MKGFLRLVLLGAFLSSCAAPPKPPAYALKPPPPRPSFSPAEARAEIEALVAASGLDERDFGVFVATLPDEELFYARRPDRPMVPASNLKLVTAAAALDAWGPLHRFRTPVYRNEGALHIRGVGDPSLQVLMLKDIVRLVQIKGGGEGFDGRVLLDDGLYEVREEINPDFRRSGAYNPSLGPLSVDRNRVQLHLLAEGPASDGVRPIVPRVTPDPDGFLVWLASPTLPFETHHAPQFEVEWNEELGLHEIRALGPLSPGRHSLAVRRPTVHFGRVLRETALAGGLPLREVGEAPVPEGAELLFSYTSPPLYEILRAMNLRSDNFVAESLALAMAARAGGRTLEDAAEALEGFLVREAGLRPGSFRVANGSGLSREPQLSPRQFGKLLAAVQRRRGHAGTYETTLPIAGWSGTMSRRLLDPPGLLRVSAKTGMVDYVSAVSGYGTGRDGTRFVFSVLVNDLSGLARTRGWTPLMRESQEEWALTTRVMRAQRAVQDKILDVLARTRFE